MFFWASLRLKQGFLNAMIDVFQCVMLLGWAAAHSGLGYAMECLHYVSRLCLLGHFL